MAVNQNNNEIFMERTREMVADPRPGMVFPHSAAVGIRYVEPAKQIGELPRKVQQTKWVHFSVRGG
jgi:hypothetical protein